MRNLFLLAASAIAIAAAPADNRSAVLKAVTDCRAVTESTARLACYDGAVGRLDAAATKKEIVVLDREEVKQTRRGLFGFSLPRIPLFKGDDAKDTPAQVETTARSVRSLGYGKWRIVMEDGAIWATTEPSSRRDPKEGSRIRIKAGTMGAYFLSIDGAASVRAKREG